MSITPELDKEAISSASWVPSPSQYNQSPDPRHQLVLGTNVLISLNFHLFNKTERLLDASPSEQMKAMVAVKSQGHLQMKGSELC